MLIQFHVGIYICLKVGGQIGKTKVCEYKLLVSLQLCMNVTVYIASEKCFSRKKNFRHHL